MIRNDLPGILPRSLGRIGMKFVLLESRGGNYLVVAQNIAWLRTGENGQTNVGMVGGSPLLVSGTIEEVAAKIGASA
jgi:periplasmic protein TonB